jgi:hypothetical protein
MQNELDSKFLLRVFSKIEKAGQKIDMPQGPGFALDGVTVNAGFDGYDLYFNNGKVLLTLGFHHKWHSDAKSGADMEEFIAQLKKIDRNY